MRIKIIRFIVAGLFLLIVCDLFYVQAVTGKYFYRLSSNNRIRVISKEGGRGRILDRQGVVLAENRESYNITLTPQVVENQQGLFEFLSRLLRIPAGELIQQYREKKTADFAPVLIAEDVQREIAIAVEENKYRFPALMVEQSFRRIYPLGTNGAHVLGYVGKANRARMLQQKEYGYSAQSMVGYLGVEEYYDSYLKGMDGGIQVEVNSRGRQMRMLGLKEAEAGQDIVLTIDSRVQEAASRVLAENRGAIIVMDARNGEILTLASAPAYDPNAFSDRLAQNMIRSYFRDPDAPLLNRAVSGAFPPGSIFKIPIAVAGLDLKKIHVGTMFDCSGFLEIGGRRFGCTHVHGRQNLTEAMAHSCNIYFYHLGMILKAEALHNYAQLFGLGRLTHIDLPYEKTGFLPHPRQRLISGRRWFTGDTLNYSIGQGDLLTTPLQLVRMMATVARAGVEVQPHVILKIGDVPVTKFNFIRSVPLNADIYRILKKALRATVSDYSGTAHALDIPGMFIAGKTGTAQSGGGDHHAWFVGYTEGTKTEVAFAVFLERGGSSQNACLVARQLLLEMQKKGIL